MIVRILVFMFLITVSGCTGCSRSGRNSLRKEAVGQVYKGGDKNRSRRNETKPVTEADSKVTREEKVTSPISHIVKDSPTVSINLTDLYEKNRKGVFLIFSTNDGETGAQGTGFFVDENGLAISNQHVFDGYNQHYIKLHDGSAFMVTEILKQSHQSELDYVIFKVDTQGEKVFPLKIASYVPTVGEDVFAIGNPKGLEHTLSKGIISAYREQKSLLQTTAEITNGSSGGPLFNMNGEVVGITTAGIGEANLNFVVNIQRLGLKKYLY